MRMRVFYLFFSNFCKNCAYYNPVPSDVTLEKSTCLKFNKFVDMCREDETKCGKNGKHFKQKSNETNQSINQIIVSCKTCKHYEQSFNRCTAFKKTNIITGVTVYDYIELCRHDETKCGEYGKFYTPK